MTQVPPPAVSWALAPTLGDVVPALLPRPPQASTPGSLRTGPMIPTEEEEEVSAWDWAKVGSDSRGRGRDGKWSRV